MAFLATVLKVMIAGPSDVKAEKAIALEKVNYWNQLHAEDKATILYPVRWDTHATARMGASGQDIINLEVLKDSDYLIAIFGITLGTPTEFFPSGTVEEIKRHVAAGKVAVVCFSSKPIPRNFDKDQLKKLEEFQTECRSAGLYVDFDSDETLREKIYQHINSHIQRWKREFEHFQKGPAVPLKNPFEDDGDFVDDTFSPEALELLRAARLENGTLVLLSIGGEHDSLLAGQRDFFAGGGESMANYEEALSGLLQDGYFTTQIDGPAVTHIKLTKHGWQAAKKMD